MARAQRLCPAGWPTRRPAAPFTASPDIVYSPIVPVPMPLLVFVTNRLAPSVAIANGLDSPVMSEAFTVAPIVVYSPTIPGPELVTNRSDPDTTMPDGSVSPVMSDGFTGTPAVVYSPTAPPPIKPPVVTNRFEPDTAIPLGSVKNVIRKESRAHLLWCIRESFLHWPRPRQTDPIQTP